MLNKKLIAVAAGLGLFMTAGTASALAITPDFSMLGTVYSSAGGDLSNSAMAGYSDVTAAFEADAYAAIADWQRADLVPFTLTTQITLANLGSEKAAGDSLVTSTDPITGLPLTSQIRIDDSVGDPTYVQANPYDNSQFTASTQSTTINGNVINIGRIYQGTPVALPTARTIW